jgi:ElaB/YqjD/DUF883 family membrane-anchored ribosome-binding protein
MTTNSHKSSAEIERDVENTREHITETLDELRARMSPGQMLDEAIDYARHSGGGEMMRNLGRTMRDNPTPLLLIGAGIAWMMATDGAARRRSDGAAGAHFSSAASRARDAASRLGEGASSMADKAAGAAAGMGDTLASTADSARRSMHDARDSVSEAGSSAYRTARDLSGSASALLHDQPLVMGALGFAIGAALGGAIPETRMEDRMMGDTRDALKDSTTAMAAEQYEKAKDVAEKTVEEVQNEADKQGLTTESVEDVADDLGRKAGAVVNAGKEKATKEAKRQNLGGSGSGASSEEWSKGLGH